MIDLAGVEADPIDTILKIELATPLGKIKSKREFVTAMRPMRRGWPSPTLC